MILTAGAIAELIGGVVDGNPDVTVDSVSPITDGRPGSLTFLADPEYAGHMLTTAASVVIVPTDYQRPENVQLTLIRADEPYAGFAVLLNEYEKQLRPLPGIHPSAVIAGSALVGKGVFIGPGAVLGEHAVVGDHSIVHAGCLIGPDVRIGKNCTVHAGAKVLRACVIGDDCKLHAGAVIGSDGFGFAPQGQTFNKIPQIGNVILEDRVEIGANTTVDRATVGSTIIRKGVKLDNLIQVAHNVEIGENTVIAAQTGIAGSTRIGRQCMVGGQVGIIGHLTIGDHVQIAAQSGIGHDLKDHAVVQGSPAFEVGNYRRAYVSFRRLPQILRKIEDRLKELSS